MNSSTELRNHRLANNGTIDIVEDDLPLAEGLSMLLESQAYLVRHFTSGEEFLKMFFSEPDDPRLLKPGCILLDIRLSSQSGLAVFDQVAGSSKQFTKPVIFMTGHGDMEIAVDVLTRGAFDFLTKPFVSEALMAKVERAVEKSRSALDVLSSRELLRDRISRLTQKEMLVMQGIASGKSNREIADETGNSIRTIELHRAHVLQKLAVQNAVELANVLARSDLIDAPRTTPL
jgi:two-component system response regulator DctR